MNLLELKYKFQQKSSNLRRIFDRYSLIEMISRLECEIWPNLIEYYGQIADRHLYTDQR